MSIDEVIPRPYLVTDIVDDGDVRGDRGDQNKGVNDNRPVHLVNVPNNYTQRKDYLKALDSKLAFSVSIVIRLPHFYC